MSSPDAPARSRARKTPAGKGGAKKVAIVNDAGMTHQDKANFVKAIAEGLPPKGGAKGKAAADKTQPRVEVLRKISAPAPARPANAESKQALAFAAMLEAKTGAGDFEILTPEAFQALMGALCKLYSANADAGNKYPVVSGRAAISGTDAMIVCAALLRAVDLQVFELGMWQSWAGV